MNELMTEVIVEQPRLQGSVKNDIQVTLYKLTILLGEISLVYCIKILFSLSRQSYFPEYDNAAKRAAILFFF